MAAAANTAKVLPPEHARNWKVIKGNGKGLEEV
jgi:hypothetical protein